MDEELIKRLSDMLSAADVAVNRSKNMSFEKFVEDDLIYEGFVRKIQIIGEAAYQLRRTHPNALNDIDLPWNVMIGMRHKIVHDYGDILPSIIYATTQESLPTLAVKLRAILEAET